MDIRQKAREAAGVARQAWGNRAPYHDDVLEFAIADAVAVAVLRYAIEAMPNDGEAGARVRLHHMLASLTPEPPTFHAPDGSLPRPARVFDGPGFEGGLPKATVTAAPTCATCQHYQPESSISGYCADTRPHRLQHHDLPPSWSCPMWEGKP